MKEIHTAKYNRRGVVVVQCHHRLAREGQVRIVSVWKGTRGLPALNYVTSLVILRLAQVGRRSCRRYVRNTLRNRLVVWSTAILTYTSKYRSNCLYSLFPLFLAQMYDLTPMIFTVPMWGSEVTNSKTEIHITNTCHAACKEEYRP